MKEESVGCGAIWGQLFRWTDWKQSLTIGTDRNGFLALEICRSNNNSEVWGGVRGGRGGSIPWGSPKDYNPEDKVDNNQERESFSETSALSEENSTTITPRPNCKGKCIWFLTCKEVTWDADTTDLDKIFPMKKIKCKNKVDVRDLHYSTDDMLVS